MADIRFREKQDPVFDTLRGNIGLIREWLMKQKDTETEQKNKIKQAILKGLVTGKIKPKKGMTPNYRQLGMPEGIDMGQFEPVNRQTGTSVSITQRPYAEILKAQEVAGRTPEDYANAGMAMLGARIRGTGILGTGYGPGSKREAATLSPAAQQQQKMAQEIIMNPYKKSYRFGGGLPEEEDATITDSEGNAYDASEYEEGTQAEIDGVQYKIENGQWVLLQ